MIRKLPVKPVVAALTTLPINVLLAVGEHMVAGNRQPLFNRMDTAAALLGDWSRIPTVLNLHIWTPGPDEERRSGSLAEAGPSYTREAPDDVVRTSRFLGLPNSDDGKPDETVRYDVVHCISTIGISRTGGSHEDAAGSYQDPVGSYEDPVMFLGFGRHAWLSPGTLRDALVRCGARLFILQSLGDRHIGKSAERLARFVAGAGGPAVLVVADGRSEQGLCPKGAADGSDSVNAYLRDVYRRILGNQPIEDGAAGAAGRPERLFAYGPGGDRLLRFDSMMERLEQQLRDYAGLVNELLDGMRRLEHLGLATRHGNHLRSLHKLQPWIGAVRAELARARTSVADGAILLAAVATEVSRIKAEVGHHRGEGFLHTKFDMLEYEIDITLREQERVATEQPDKVLVPSSAAPSFVPATERQINIWIGEGDAGLKQVLQIGETYLLHFRVGQPVSGSLTSGEAAAVSSRDVPPGGLPTDWLVVADGAELAAGTPDTEVSTATIGGLSTWSGRFKILIPEEGDSATPQLRIKPLRAAPAIEVVITARKEEGFPRFNEVYRQFKIELAAADRPDTAPVQPIRIADELMPTPTAHVGLRTTHEWTTPNGILSVIVFGPQAAVQGIAGAEQVDSLEPWVGAPAQVSGRIENVRDAAEEMRAIWEHHINNIDPFDLADRLTRWSRHEGGPEYDWSLLGNYADAAHRQEWDQMAVSKELRRLAHHGRQLFQAFFPRGSNFHNWITALIPGARLSISWTPKAGAGFIPHVPFGLMYTADLPPEGQPVDPMGFLGLRCRIAYNSHVAAPASRSLGALDATHRAHFLYWGDAPGDITGQEARWQRAQWSAWQNQIFIPQTVQNAKAELLKLLNDPQPAPTSVLYLFCQCNPGAGNNPRLRFGSTNDPANVILQTDFGTSALADRPLVFANACTTVAADPYMANDLEEAFFDRDCRAYIGTETKVPIIFGSRFAEIFFRFFYRLLDPAPMAAGEAVTQARLFLWTHYRNIGGLFYTHVNQYDLFLAREDEVLALRG
jgi:hypothetical protein